MFLCMAQKINFTDNEVNKLLHKDILQRKTKKYLTLVVNMYTWLMNEASSLTNSLMTKYHASCSEGYNSPVHAAPAFG